MCPPNQRVPFAHSIASVDSFRKEGKTFDLPRAPPKEPVKSLKLSVRFVALLSSGLASTPVSAIEFSSELREPNR